MKADVLIVSGGIMGCATAIELARKGKSVIEKYAKKIFVSAANLDLE
jgi:glycine/D-amino acid oxidase-like deaminating enzyme